MKPAAMPLWLKWVLTLLVFAAVTVVVVIYVGRNNGSQQYQGTPAADAQADSVGQAVRAQDQAARRAQLPRSPAAHAALARAIVLDMRTRVAQHQVTGPVRRVSWSALARKARDQLRFRCHATVGGFSYPFMGVADLRTHVLIWCTDDRASYDPSVEAPLSRSCTG